MPPIMGAAAFLMADIIGVPYSDILSRAIFPAVLYFTGIFVAVHLEAKKHGLTGVPVEKLPKFSLLLKKIYLLAPLVLLVVWVSKNMMTMQRAAAYSIVVAILVGIIEGFVSGNRFTLKKFLESLEAGGRGTITVGAACGVAGIISGTITMTGLANEMINAIVAVAGNKLFIALFLTMLCCIVLGMGVPTTATYCIMAATCAPILTRMGVPIIAAHFFVFYFGIVADITPPVALAAYAGSAIAKSNPMHTAIAATKMAVAAFLIPYIFCFSPEMLLIDTNVSSVIIIYATALIGIMAVAAALEGYLFTDMKIWERIILIVGGIMLISPGGLTDAAGLGVIVVALIMQFISKKRIAHT